MPSDPGFILGFDTSAAHCAAAVVSGDRVVASTAEEMGRGQAERLFPMIEEMLASAGLGWRDLSRIGVGVGPGNFTGIRIAVASARGLALSLGVPAIGVSGFEAIHAGTPHAVAAIPAPRDQLYIARPGAGAEVVPAALAGDVVLPPPPEEMAIRIARLAGVADPAAAPPPAPLYLRAADAAPPRDAPPVIVDDA